MMAAIAEKKSVDRISEQVSEVRTLSGTAEQISKKIDREQKIFAFVSDDERVMQVLVQTFELLAPSLNRLVEEQQFTPIENIFRLLLPPLTPTPEMMAEAKMRLAARQAVMNDGPWLTAAKVSELAGYSEVNPATHPNRWKKAGAVFAINYNGMDYYPFYALDPAQEYKPTKALKEILKVLRSRMDDWGVALWFGSLNSRLSSRKPQDLLLTQPDLVLAAAQEEVIGIQHG